MAGPESGLRAGGVALGLATGGACKRVARRSDFDPQPATRAIQRVSRDDCDHSWSCLRLSFRDSRAKVGER